MKISMAFENDQVFVTLPCEKFYIAQDAVVVVQGKHKKSTHMQHSLVGHGEVNGRSAWTGLISQEGKNTRSLSPCHPVLYDLCRIRLWRSKAITSRMHMV